MTRSILITGASSGLGAALARFYAAPDVHLSLWGRDAGRLTDVARDCREHGAAAETTSFDMRHPGSLAEALAGLDAERQIDLAIFCAGLGGTIGDRRVESPARAMEIATVNFTACVVGAAALAERMVERGRGQIVLIGSIAGAFPLPIAPTYSGSKAGLKVFAEALRLRVAPLGVAVTHVAPGFIDTPMSRQITGPKPWMASAEAAAAIVARAAARQAGHLVFPRAFAAVRAAYLCLPGPLRRAIMARLKP